MTEFDDLLAQAETGKAEAQFKVGRSYANGKGVSRDQAEAARWYRLAAQQGHAKALREMRNRRLSERAAQRQWEGSGEKQLEEQELRKLKSEFDELSERIRGQIRAIRFTDRAVRQSSQWRRNLLQLDDKFWQLKIASMFETPEVLDLSWKGRRQVLKDRLQAQTTRNSALGGLSGELAVVESSLNEKSRVKWESIDPERLNWELLPPGTTELGSTIKGYLHQVRTESSSRREFDDHRLAIALLLEPSEAFVGRGEFSHYIVFGFSYTESKLLENPSVGNAIYVLRKNWERLSRLSKDELLGLTDTRQPEVRRIVHRGEWLVRLEEELDVPDAVKVRVSEQFTDSGAPQTD